jgi:RNA polymerase sigma factor (sigma-70 family)
MKTEILTDLKVENNSAFGELYKAHFGMVNRFIRNNKGRTDDAEDIFQDTMIVLLEKLRKDDFQLTASIKTYVMAIAKNLWLKRLRTSYREIEFTENLDNKFFEEINSAIEKERSYWERLRLLLPLITIHCQRIIDDIFFKEKQISQIQKEYGYTTKHNAQNQKHKCVEQLKKVKEQEEKK